MEFIKGLVSQGQATTLVGFIVANFGLGTLAAIKGDMFEFAKLLNIWKRVGVVFLAYLVVAFVATVLVDFDAMRTIIFAALIAYLAAQVVSNLKDLGIPIPDWLMKYIERK